MKYPLVTPVPKVDLLSPQISTIRSPGQGSLPLPAQSLVAILFPLIPRTSSIPGSALFFWPLHPRCPASAPRMRYFLVTKLRFGNSRLEGATIGGRRGLLVVFTKRRMKIEHSLLTFKIDISNGSNPFSHLRRRRGA